MHNHLSKISCCIDMMFSYCDFYDRIVEVKKCGINTVEFWQWANKDIAKIKKLLDQNKMKLSVFNIDSKDTKLSQDLSHGILNLGKTDEFVSALCESAPVYKKLGASAMIILVGENAPFCEKNVLQCLNAAKPICEKENITLVIEPLNDIDHKNYSMPYVKPIFELLKKVKSPNIKLLYDIYHQNMMGDFDIKEIKNNIDLIGHFHVADVPGRHEPGTGKIDYAKIFKEIDKTDYNGYIGLEYKATKKDSETFGFLNR